MNDILQSIEKQTKLNENDKIIIHYVIEHLDEIPRISSRELARRTYTTSTSVIRLIKKMGFENYNDFKLNVTTFMKQIVGSEMQVKLGDDLLTLVNKVSNIETHIIAQTKEMLSMETLKKAQSLLGEADYIDIIATDTNASMADYFSHILWGLGKIVNVYKDEDVQLFYALNVPKGHAAMIISRYGLAKHIQKVANDLHQKHIPVIIFTTAKEKNLSKKADCVFYGCDYGAADDLGKLVFYTSLKYLFDLLNVILLAQNDKEITKIKKLLLSYYQ